MEYLYILGAIFFALTFAFYNKDLDPLMLGMLAIGIGATWPFIVAFAIFGLTIKFIVTMINTVASSESAKEFLQSLLVFAIGFPTFLLMMCVSVFQSKESE